MEDLPAVEPVKIYENTYRLEPADNEKFKVGRAKKIMDEVLAEKLAFTNDRDKKGRLAWTYDADECRELSQDIAAEILEKVKAASGEMPRYKLVCQATVGESNGQSMRVASRCLWDKDFDTCAETTWTNNKVYAVAMCFALYYE